MRKTSLSFDILYMHKSLGNTAFISCSRKKSNFFTKHKKIFFMDITSFQNGNDGKNPLYIKEKHYIYLSYGIKLPISNFLTKTQYLL